MIEDPLISVIVPVWNGEEHINACLRALEAQTYPRDRYEIIVVDNGSTDRTREIIGFHPDATLVEESLPGSYNARNRGLSVAGGEFVAFTDADCTPASNWIEAGIAAVLRNPGAGIVGGQIRLRGGSGNSSTCLAFENMFSFNQEQYLRDGHCTTANWISPTAVLREIGGFDGSLRSGGDFDLSGRIHSSGYGLVYEPDMMVDHPFRGSVGEIIKKRIRVTGGEWAMRKNLSSRARYGARIIKNMFQSIPVVISRRNGLVTTIKVILFIVVLSMVQLIEIVRLCLGGTPRRA